MVRRTTGMIPDRRGRFDRNLACGGRKELRLFGKVD
jgi:hypothetical protein